MSTYAPGPFAKAVPGSRIGTVDYESATPSKKRKWAIWAVIGIIILHALIGLGIYLWWRNRKTSLPNEHYVNRSHQTTQNCSPPCQKGDVCKNGSCYPNRGTCPPACTDGYKCIGHKCKAMTYCSNSSPCPLISSQICDTTMDWCLDLDPCGAGNTCPPNYTCDSGHCFPPFCGQENSCPSGYECTGENVIFDYCLPVK